MSTVAPWEQPNLLTWIRKGADGKPVATVRVNPDTSAFATVLVHNQANRRTCPDEVEAKRWCDECLANPPQPIAPRDRTPDPAPAPPAPATPKGNPVERLLKILRNDPDLAWEVANKAKALGPWERLSGDWWHRLDASGAAVAVVQSETIGRTSAAGVMETSTAWRWSELIPNRDGGNEVATRTGYTDLADAQRDCDEHLRTRDWLLATRPLTV